VCTITLSLLIPLFFLSLSLSLYPFFVAFFSSSCLILFLSLSHSFSLCLSPFLSFFLLQCFVFFNFSVVRRISFFVLWCITYRYVNCRDRFTGYSIEHKPNVLSIFPFFFQYINKTWRFGNYCMSFELPAKNFKQTHRRKRDTATRRQRRKQRKQKRLLFLKLMSICLQPAGDAEALLADHEQSLLALCNRYFAYEPVLWSLRRSTFSAHSQSCSRADDLSKCLAHTRLWRCSSNGGSGSTEKTQQHWKSCARRTGPPCTQSKSSTRS
jgi:hypothetical protein